MKILAPIALGAVIALLLTPILGAGFQLLNANEGNELVATTIRLGDNLVDPFRGIFTPRQPELANGIAWGIAAGFYVILATVLGMIFKKAH